MFVPQAQSSKDLYIYRCSVLDCVLVIGCYGYSSNKTDITIVSAVPESTKNVYEYLIPDQIGMTYEWTAIYI
jgi:hypothetical protein